MQMLDGRSFIGETVQAPVMADRPEPPRHEPQWLTKAEILRRQKWTEAAFEVAIGLAAPIQFPTACRRPRPGAYGVDLIWRDSDIDAWVRRVREHIARVQALVGRP